MTTTTTHITRKPCKCGSGRATYWAYDARGIPTNRVCLDCEAEDRKKWRPEIFTNPNYATDEPIDDEY